MWKWLKAYFRLDLHTVCELSIGNKDYHDYTDDKYGRPAHFCALKCKRCGKIFTI